MIRLHALMILALAQAVLSERLVLDLATGGQGHVPVLVLLVPWATLALVVIPFRRTLARVLGTSRFFLLWMPFLAMGALLPLLGVACTGFPARSLFAAWEALIPCAFLVIGCVVVLQAEAHGAAVARYFLLAVLLHFGLALVQTAGRSGSLPGVLGAVDRWDLHSKEAIMPGNIVVARATGFYLNPNTLGVWSLLAFWTSFFLLRGRQRVLGCAAAFGTLLLCQSRGTLAAFLVSGGVYALTWLLLLADTRRRRQATLGLVACAASILILAGWAGMGSMPAIARNVPVLQEALERDASGLRVLSHGSAADVNFHGRTMFWQAAWQYLLAHPFGTLGPPQLKLKIPSDNQFVAVLAQGSFYYFSTLLLVFLGGVRLMRRSQPCDRLLAVASVALLINGLSASPLYYPSGYLYWLLVGISMGRRHQQHPAEEMEPCPDS
jgi:hypothetical protein